MNVRIDNLCDVKLWQETLSEEKKTLAIMDTFIVLLLVLNLICTIIILFIDIAVISQTCRKVQMEFKVDDHE